MALRRFILIGLLFIGVSVLTVNTLAQSDLDAAFTSPDETFTLHFPSTWDIDDADATFVVLSNDALEVYAYSTVTIDSLVLDASTPTEVVSNLASFVDFVGDDIQSTSIDGRAAAVVAVEFNNKSGALILIEMDDGGYGLLMVLGAGAALESNANLVIRIAATYNLPNVVNNNTLEDTPAVTLLEEIARAITLETAIPVIEEPDDNDSTVDTSQNDDSSDDSSASDSSSAADALRGDDSSDDSDESDSSSAADALRGGDSSDDSDESDSSSAADALRGGDSSNDSDESDSNSAADALRGGD
ncbi:MAG: hypothetical protein Q9P01_10720 [Anaerolineae bacterium]|nr:hypothetical protein [Anaerolineae bacterium]MDQ7035276.1 hypothetical protein [Anaerolineae bacterium]